MENLAEVFFRVRMPRLRDWQMVLVVGSTNTLGEWDPTKAMQLTKCNIDNDVWFGKTEVTNSTKEVKFRYLIGYHLDPCREQPRKILIVDRWESLLQPRCISPIIENQNGVVRAGFEHIFGSYDGKIMVSDGWIMNSEEHVVLLRIHGEALKFYKARYKDKEQRLKIVPFDVRFKERDSLDDEGATDAESDPFLPDVPSFSHTELSVLTREDPIFGEQYVNGSLFRNNQDYLVFRTRTVSIEHLAFRIELYHDTERVGLAYALPAALPDTYGKSTFPIISTRNIPMGQIDVNYMLVKELPVEKGIRDNMAHSWGRYWRKRKTIEVGHRGMGSSYTKLAVARENTIHSLNEAAKNGADFVEFDVQLTKDLHPVIYHDFHVLVEVSRRKEETSKLSSEHKHHQMAIKDLKLSQLHLLHLEHAGQNHPESLLRVTPGKDEQELGKGGLYIDHYPFPSLIEVLTDVNPLVGFNIEVKYPMKLKDGSHECTGYFERNSFIDIILKEVFIHAGNRRVLFSSFDPDICNLISQKQHRYPVLFLVVGDTARYVPFQDIRSDCSRMAVNYAAGSKLLGVNFHSEELLKNSEPLRRAEKYNLVSFVWGDDLNTKKNIDYFKNELKVDGLIYDRIGELESRQNIFLVEKEAKAALFEQNSGCTSLFNKTGQEDLSGTSEKNTADGTS